MKLTKDFRLKVREAILADRENYGGSDAAYAKTLGINASAFSVIKKGETERVVSDDKWLNWGRRLNVTLHANTWKIARTVVYVNIENNLQYCKNFSKSMILVDNNGIGKTECAKHVIQGIKNAFYFDCSQAKTKQQFIRKLALTIGIDDKGKYTEVKDNLKYYLNIIERPLIVLDEAGDLEYMAFLEIKELWNGTEGNCGWYMMGAAGLAEKVEAGIKRKKVGFAEIFDRFADEFVNLVPKGDPRLKTDFYQQLIGDVALVNAPKGQIPKLVRKCVTKDKTKSLRHLKDLITANN